MIDVVHSGPVLLASFLASSVECVEALTIVLAVGSVRGWRPALFGAGLAVALLAALVAVFGVRWLRKAVLHAGGVIPLRDEIVNYASETEICEARPGRLADGTRTALRR